jgi:hypothetical protein
MADPDTMMIRVAPDLKKDVMALAVQRGTDLTKLVNKLLTDACNLQRGALDLDSNEARSAEADLIQKALTVIGSPEGLAEWMQTWIPALRGRTPYSLMDSDDGRKQVEIVLGRIEHGVY